MTAPGSHSAAGAGDGRRDGTDPELHVRPLNYVADRPVVRRVGDREVYIGNHLAADPAACDRSFDRVLSLTAAAQPATTQHRPLEDGPGNDWTDFERAVETARELVRRDGSLLVHCKAGISRSSAVLATALAAEEDRRFRGALALVQDARPHAVPNPALHELGVVYLATGGQR